MDVDAYLKRIRYRGPREVSAHTLRDLHRAHMMTVPFENLDIHERRPIVLNNDALYSKIVERKRGGFCYELNGLFSELLRSLGFSVQMLCARVARADGTFGPPFDHMTLLVKLERDWLADVGFGDSFVEPLALEPGLTQFQWGKNYRISRLDQEFIYESMDHDAAWHREYSFTLQPFEYPDYEEMCVYHQTSPQSSFTQKRVCSRATPDGRITLTGQKFIETTGWNRNERLLSDADYGMALREYFGIVL